MIDTKGLREDANWHKSKTGRQYWEKVWAASSELDAKTDALNKACEMIIWMSGSSDFSPGGAAHAGWIKNKPIIDEIMKVARG